MIQYTHIDGIHKIIKHLEPEWNNLQWEVTRKLDGSNFSIICEKDQQPKFASRTQLIPENTNFQNYLSISEELKVKAILLSEILFFEQKIRKIFIKDKIKKIYIFGEIYGKGVQNRIYYGPKVYFSVFDILVEYNIEPKSYLDKNIVHDLCENVGFNYVPILYKGVLQDILKNIQPEGIWYPGRLESEIHKINDPISKDKIYYEEGIVISPDKELTFGNGKRVIFKITYETEKLNRVVEKTSKISSEEKDKLSLESFDFEILNELLSLVDDNLYHSTLSKFPDYQYQKDKLAYEMYKDLFDTYTRETGKKIDTQYKSKIIVACKNLILTK